MDELDSFLFYDDYTIGYQGSGKPIASTLENDEEETPTKCRSACVPQNNGVQMNSCARASRAHSLVVTDVTQTVTAWEVDRVNHEPVWPAAHLLCCFLVSDAGVAACRDRRVLEVGSGVGLTGLVASHFARCVTPRPPPPSLFFFFFLKKKYKIFNLFYCGDGGM